MTAKATLNGFTIERLRAMFRYDAETGRVVSKVQRGSGGSLSPAGTVIGTPHGNGYLRVGIAGKRVFVHRLAYFLEHEIAPKYIDHADRKRDGSNVTVLRSATQSQNMANSPKRTNNTSGFKGVRFEAGRWRARIKVNYVTQNLGRFDTAEEAHLAYTTAAKRFFGEFACP